MGCGSCETCAESHPADLLGSVVRAIAIVFLNTRAEVNRDSLYSMPTTVGVAQRATHAGPRRRRGGGGLR